MSSLILAAAIGLAISLLTIWLILAAALVWIRPDRATLNEAVRLPADIVRLVRRLLSDSDLPRGARIRLWLLLGYLLMPIDIVPDFIPIIGYADDVVVTAVLLRGTIRVAGINVVERNWTGTAAGLTVLTKLCGHAGQLSQKFE